MTACVVPQLLFQYIYSQLLYLEPTPPSLYLEDTAACAGCAQQQDRLCRTVYSDQMSENMMVEIHNEEPTSTTMHCLKLKDELCWHWFIKQCQYYMPNMPRTWKEFIILYSYDDVVVSVLASKSSGLSLNPYYGQDFVSNQ